jgi:zinc transporter 9
MHMVIRDNKNSQGFLPVFAALTGNIFIAAIKWMGFFASGSGALFSEAVHSVADVFNQILLMVGIKRSQKPWDKNYPYGYGNERFFWAVVSACSIFFIGAGVTVYHGVGALISGEEVQINPIIFGILLISLIVETGTFLIALRELKMNNPEKSFREMLDEGDTTTIAVLFEDGIAVLGVVIALASILLTYLTGHAFWDAIGSIIIGVLLGVMAVLLIDRNRRFLIRKSIPEDMKNRIIEILEGDPAIERVSDFKSGVLDVDKYHVKCEVEMNGSALMRTMYRENALKKEFEEIDSDYAEFLRFCVDYADRVPRMIGTRIDDVENRIKKELPQIRHIDIEVN